MIFQVYKALIAIAMLVIAALLGFYFNLVLERYKNQIHYLDIETIKRSDTLRRLSTELMIESK